MSKSPSLRRIQADIRELSLDPSDQYFAAPLENDMFEWHFTIKGADGTDFEGGVYHGRILLPAEYPFKPPNIVFLTPNGRFETGMKVCLSFSAYHPELWQPAWGIRLILEALISFLPTKGDGAIGALDWSSDERKRLAKESINYNCPVCGNCAEVLKRWENNIQSKVGAGVGKKSRFQKEIEQLHVMQIAHEGGDKSAGDDKVNTKDSAAKDDKDEKAKKESVAQVDMKDSMKEESNQGIDGDNASTEESKDERPLDGKEAKPIDSSRRKKEELKVENANKKRYESGQDSDIVLGTFKNDQPTSTEREPTEGEIQTEPNVATNTIPEGVEGEDATEANELAQSEEEANVANTENLEAPWISDPVIHTGIVVLSIIIYLLTRKIQVIIAEMKQLEDEFHS